MFTNVCVNLKDNLIGINMSCTVVVGMQWGDEGKGKIVDLMTNDYDIVVRYQGGNNAGHTIVYDDKKIVLHSVPSGIIQNKICVLGNGVVIEPISFLAEINALEKSGYNITECLKISDLAHIVLPYHQMLDTLREENRDPENKIGTTGKGIGPVYQDKIARQGLRLCDLRDSSKLLTKLTQLIKKKVLETEFVMREDIDYNININNVYKTLQEFYKRIQHMLIDSSLYLNEALDLKKKILFEGAQGTFLDIDYGTYPFVTSSNTLSAAACLGSGIGPVHIQRVLGVIKSYATRVGNGPFVTELNDNDGKYLQSVGLEFGSTTGRTRRCGWFDAVMAKKAVQLNGVSDLVMTKVDVLDKMEEIKVAVAYQHKDGNITDTYPVTNLEDYVPIYKKFQGWCCDTTQIKRAQDLPENLLLYIQEIEHLLKVPVSMISSGPNRSQIIQMWNVV